MAGDDVILVASDDVKFTVNRKALRLSQTITDLIADEEDVPEVPIPQANGVILKYLVDFIMHYENADPTVFEQPLKGEFKDLLNDWEKGFLYTDLVKGGDDKQHEVLVDVILAADALAIASLLDLCTGAIAGAMRTAETADKMREVFQLPNDLGDDAAKIAEQNTWIEDC